MDRRGRINSWCTGHPANREELTSIWEVDAVCWLGDHTVPTVGTFSIMCGSSKYPSHPVILGTNGRVMDGMHRVARVLLEGRAMIEAVQIEGVPEPDFRDDPSTFRLTTTPSLEAGRFSCEASSLRPPIST